MLGASGTAPNTKSAKSPGRPEFNRMMEGLRKGEANAIVCWNLDRLARNPLDGGQLMWALSEGLVREIATPARTYTNSGPDKLTMSIEFGLATHYVDNLSSHVKKSIVGRLERGIWPAKPKIGYVRNQETGELMPDPERFHLVRELFRLKLSGVPAKEILARARTEWRLTTPQFRSVGGKCWDRPQQQAHFLVPALPNSPRSVLRRPHENERPDASG